LTRKTERKRTSSHQFKVEVTGLQYPSLGWGYGNEGRYMILAELLRRRGIVLSIRGRNRGKNREGRM
jgi:hypothetical protein